eukprot:m.19854 g.19854  ORF g.19854 m.19854 type:complete len:74 (+) comp11958_c1_seq2:173-394(+)
MHLPAAAQGPEPLTCAFHWLLSTAVPQAHMMLQCLHCMATMVGPRDATTVEHCTSTTSRQQPCVTVGVLLQKH